MNQAQSTGKDAFAMAVVIVLNWLIAHLATNWVLPPEVQSAMQAIIAIGSSWLITRRMQQQAVAPVAAPDPAKP